MPSYAIVQSYMYSTVFCSYKRQCKRPVLRGRMLCLKPSTLFLCAHLWLEALPLTHRFVPFGNMSNHIGSRYCGATPERSPLLVNFCSRYWKRAFSLAYFLEKNTKP